MVPRAAAVSCLLAALAAPTPAVAQAPGDARDLATRGRAAFDGGDLATGCPLLDEAYRLDPDLLGAGYALAECREKEGKLATAHAIFLGIAARAAARGEARAEEARARAEALVPRLPRLRVDVVDVARGRSGLAITVDGEAWPLDAIGDARPIDPGPHELVVTVDGEPPWTSSVDATEGVTIDAVVPFGRATAPAGPVAPPPPPADPDEGDGVPWRTAGLVTAGVGAGLLGVGVVLGLAAKGSYDGVRGCDADGACTPEGAAERNDARGLADVGTVFFIAGGVLAAGGVTVFLVAPDDATPATATAAVRVAPGAVTLGGRF